MCEDAWAAATAAERKRILGLLDAEVTILTERDIDLGRIRRAIEHPEPDAGPLLRCQERNAESGQCELKISHNGPHLAGMLMWAEPDAGCLK